LFFLKRHRSGGEVFRTGGVSIQARGDLEYFDLKQPESVQGWRKKWFYLQDERTPSTTVGAPEFSPDATVVKRRSWRHGCMADEEAEVAPLMARVRELQLKPGKEVSGTHIIAIFLQRRVQPLKARVRALWEYSGMEDPMHSHKEDMSMRELEARVRSLTRLTVKDDLTESQLKCPVTPFGLENPLKQVCILSLILTCILTLSFLALPSHRLRVQGQKIIFSYPPATGGWRSG
jgi:hypothetical protein